MPYYCGGDKFCANTCNPTAATDPCAQVVSGNGDVYFCLPTTGFCKRAWLGWAAYAAASFTHTVVLLTMAEHAC